MYNHIPLSAIMTKNPLTVLPKYSLEELTDIFLTTDLHHLPVVDETGKIIGIISKNAFFRLREYIDHIQNNKDKQQELLNTSELNAAQIMDKNFMTLSPDDTVSFAALLFKKNHFQAIPIVDADDKLLGIISTNELLDYAYQKETNLTNDQDFIC